MMLYNLYIYIVLYIYSYIYIYTHTSFQKSEARGSQTKQCCCGSDARPEVDAATQAELEGRLPRGEVYAL